ncbi:MAG: energy-coupling factor transporter transmembrane protein EcfT [Rhodocyclaceae bacterium]|nr:energy-coupling factor transporter transmembrane protein EcfT [Rhodocyclaceae bacterium]
MKSNNIMKSDYACQYRAVDSPIHRLPAGWKMLLSIALSICILVIREPVPLLLVSTFCFAYYFLARLTLSDLWRDTRFFVFQFCVLLALFLYQMGYPDGIWPGVRTSIQIVLFFIPGIVFLRTTQVSSMMKGLRGIVPHRVLFLLFTSLRFVPFFARETQEIVMAQRLRGARLSPRDMRRPTFWRDLFSCIILPLLVRALKTADEAALSAEARGMGARKERTYYDVGELEEYLEGRKGDKTV